MVTTETGAYVSDNLVGRIEQYYKDEQPLFQDIVRRSSTMISLQGIEEMHIKLKAEALEHIGHKQQVCDELHRLVMPRWTVRLGKLPNRDLEASLSTRARTRRSGA